MPLPPAILLVSHGSRDPRPQQAVRQIAEWLSTQLNDNRGDRLSHPIPVETATLELAEEPLHRQIQRFAHRVLPLGVRQIALLPLFLLRGTHVMEDIPAEVELAQQALETAVEIRLYSHLGDYPGLVELWLSQMAIAPAGSRILLAHGSRRPGGNQSVEAIATRMGAVSAFWAMEPGLETQICRLVQSGQSQITVLPYFLFAGSLTDAIAQQIQDYAQRFPQSQINQAEPIGSSPALAKLICEVLQSNTYASSASSYSA